ncbi:hypothetical protein GCM10010269_13840 [Streptomyces humidus]|uniref:DUF1648 domain-containing protein n=1 Tax=Streptomyces humidus TaxID=52259 RepID=A0A918FS73_9ACTN|nr:DUF1648 domain-containing protein [Streptomyces humidus]GGR75933.1 hypothetical protein GCM10010269_13840 [Streptomyces humidus]
MKRSGRGPALAALPCLVALAADAALFVMTRRQLPDRMATHFRLDGTADGFTGRGVFMATSGLLLAGVAAIMAVLVSRAAHRSGWILVTAYAVAGLMGSLFVSVQLVNHDAHGDASTVRLSPWHLAFAVVVAAVCAGAGLLLARTLPSRGPHSPAADHARLGLADGELAAWARATGSRPLGALGLALTAAALALLPFTGPAAATPLLVGGLPCLCFARLYVTVGRQGLTVTPGRLPWPRIRLPLESMTGASHRHVDALGDFGGWGYRIRPGASGVILRSGPTLVVRRAGGREFAVTVDDPATAAALLNTLIARREAH